MTSYDSRGSYIENDNSSSDEPLSVKTQAARNHTPRTGSDISDSVDVSETPATDGRRIPTPQSEYIKNLNQAWDDNCLPFNAHPDDL